MPTSFYEHLYAANLIVTPIGGYGVKAAEAIVQGDLVSIETDNNNSLVAATDAANEQFVGQAYEDVTGGAADDTVTTRIVLGPILVAPGTANALAAPAHAALFIDAKNVVGVAGDSPAQSVFCGRKVGTKGSNVYFLAAMFCGGDTGS